MGSIFDILKTANNGLKTQREVMEISAENIANMMTPGYKARKPIVTGHSDQMSFSSLLTELEGDNRDGIASLVMGDDLGSGTQVAKIEVDNSEGAKVYMPNHPLADSDGNVEMSNVDSAGEMISMMKAVSQYKANLAIVEMAKKAAQEAISMNKNS